MSKPRIGVVGIPGKWSTETLADKVEAKTGFRLIIDMSQVEHDLTTNRLLYSGHDLGELDALIVKKISSRYSPNTLDRLELLRVAEAHGVKVFSGADRILRLVNRLSCTVTMRNGGIPMPDTCITESIESAMAAVERYGEAVFKPLFSTKARGMFVLSSEQPQKQLQKEIQAFHKLNPMMYIQRKLNLCGRDLGVVFLGGEYIGTYARVSDNKTWNTTIHSGGRYAPHSPTEEVVRIAQQAQSLFGLDFTTVDIAETDQGPVVFEVSAFGGFKGALEGANIDAAEMYADYVIQQIAI